MGWSVGHISSSKGQSRKDYPFKDEQVVYYKQGGFACLSLGTPVRALSSEQPTFQFP